MKIKEVTYEQVEENFLSLKPDLLDLHATYFGAFIDKELVGIVSYVVNPTYVYLCHAFVKEEHRGKGIYNMLWEFRNMHVMEAYSHLEIHAHCNTNSIKQFLNKDFVIEKTLFKMVKQPKNK